MLRYEVSKEDTNLILKDVLKKRIFLSTRLLTKLKNKGQILLNGEKAFINRKVNEGDRIEIDLSNDEGNEAIIPQKGELKVLYEDDYYIAVYKEPNMVVHPSSYHPDNTLSNYLKYYLGTNNVIHPVNRLDKDTSGIVLFAKNEYAQELFIRKKIKFDKVYIAIVDGILDKKEGTIDAPITRKEGSIIERCVDQKGQVAITHYKVVKEFDNKSLVEVRLETGRTHQIRVHMAYIGHPIVGDSLYGGSRGADRQLLHAYELSFLHPITEKSIIIKADIPKDMLT